MAEAWEQWHGEIVDGQYRLRQFLGGSDHSAVFLAERTSSGQRVAVKFIPAHPATATDDLARFERAAKLSHPNLLKVLASGRCQLGTSSFLYVVNELADESLSQIVPQRALTAKEAGEVLRSVLGALTYLHKKGYAHGHIVPANILATGDQIKLSSDTIAAAGPPVNPGADTVADDLPEAQRAGVSKSADVWSLGATLVEVLTQRRTAWEETAHGEPLLREKLPEPFHEIARRTLHRNPLRRPSVDEIEKLLTPAAVKAPQPAAAHRPAAGSRRGVLIAVVAAVALVAIVGWTKLSSRSHQPSQTAAVVPGSKIETPQGKLPAAPERVAQEPTHPVVPAQSANDQTPRTLPDPHPETAPVSAQPRSVAPPPTTPAQGGTSPGSVAHQVLPTVPKSARNTITGRVRVAVKVSVDAQGNVKDVTFDSPGPSKYFARLASDASRQWKFTPPRVDGQSVASEWLLRYGFGRTDTTVSSTQRKL